MVFDVPSPSFSSSPSSSCSSTLPRTPEANFWEEDNSCMTFVFDHHPSDSRRSFGDDADYDDGNDDDEYSPMKIENPSRFCKKVQRKRPPPIVTDIQPTDYSTLSVLRAPKRQKRPSSVGVISILSVSRFLCSPHSINPNARPRRPPNANPQQPVPPTPKSCAASTGVDTLRRRGSSVTSTGRRTFLGGSGVRTRRVARCLCGVRR